MSEEILFIEKYPDVEMDRVAMLWNGKRGFAFDDANQGFRERVILALIEDKSKVDAELLYELMHEEAVWANRTLSFRCYLPELAEYLLVRDFDTYGVKVAMSFEANKHASKCLIDFTVSDDIVNRWLASYKKIKVTERARGVQVDVMVGALEDLIEIRREKAKKAADFEAYIVHKDPWPIALKKGVKKLWHETEIHFLALFFIIPLVLILGYYFFGLSILYGMLPIFRTLMLLYVIYLLIAKIVG